VINFLSLRLLLHGWFKSIVTAQQFINILYVYVAIFCESTAEPQLTRVECRPIIIVIHPYRERLIRECCRCLIVSMIELGKVEHSCSSFPLLSTLSSWLPMSLAGFLRP